MPTLGDGCSSCFYAFTAPASAGVSYAGSLFCNRNAPNPITPLTQNTGFVWPQVQPDFWCGEGVNGQNGSPFNAAIQPVPNNNPMSNGTISFSLSNSANVVDASCTPNSLVKTWNISIVGGPATMPPALSTVQSSGTFAANTIGGASITGVYGYSIY